MNDVESVDDYYNYVMIVNSLKSNGKYILDVKVVEKKI